jgi:hypothetical protein
MHVATCRQNFAEFARITYKVRGTLLVAQLVEALR